jgi:hypothetical protein
MPVTTPAPVPTVATPVLLLLHVPPLVGLLKVAVSRGHILAVPVIGAGTAITVAVTVVMQPVGYA